MADCSYARCVQQRRNIRRELQRWTKNMVHIVGLERIAEELMGRRKWKLYQESMSRNYLQPLNNNINRTNPPSSEDEYHHHHTNNNKTTSATTTLTKFDSSEKDESNGKLIDSNLSPASRDDDKEYQQKENKSAAAAAAGNDIKQELLEDRLKDWSPQTKCYFCVDGKLDSEHSAHGVLSPRHSDSESSDSPSDSEAPPSLTPSSSLNNNIINNNHHHHHIRAGVQHPVTPANMTTIESVTSMAALAAVAALTGGNSPVTPAPHLPFYAPNIHNWYLANMARTFQTTAAEVADKVSGGGGEQPLDLSKGASANNNNNNSTTNIGNVHFPSAGIHMAAAATEQKIGNNVNARLPTLDTKHIYNSDFRAKPRMSAVAGRRTYTEDELQAALRDIQSGKLGTRRAAVIYGIPRSTLRNKVYKLALERERESHLVSSTPLKLDEEEVMDDEKELSGAEEEKEVEKALQGPLVTMADILRFSNMENPPDAFKNMLQKTKEGQDAWTGLDHNEIGSYLQSVLLASQNFLAANPKLTPAATDGAVLNTMIPEIMKRMMAEDHLLKLQQQSNGDCGEKMRPSPSNSVVSKPDKSRSESDMETEESSSNVILKIPSFKPTSSKNGCDLFARGDGNSLASPPVSASESGSPPTLPAAKGLVMKDVKDVIAQSISQKFQQTMEPRRQIIDLDYKRFTPPLNSGISVIKTQPELNRQYQPQHPPSQKPLQSSSGGGGGGGGGGSNSSATGGKGTRPKRGKYRNYDRDSLVEAVRAVQRGEMSVHRAGSYYGVPHSTLEYKVKERHLMRPRKRDPKPNPVDEKIASLKQNDLRNSQEKLKPVMKAPQKFAPTSPNGMKLPLFEATGMPLGGYNHPPFPFWAHPSFPALPIDYGHGRSPAAAPFPPTNPEFFASQMMQKLQEESSRTHNSTTSAPNTTPTNTPTLAKSARQMAESLLDGTGSNGSFLDGIIRSSLESGVPATDVDKSLKEDKNLAPENMSNKALLEQLCRNSRLTPLSKPNAMQDANSSEDEAYRKSPINFSTGASCHDENMDSTSSSIRHDKDTSDLHTIELSNDSNDESNERKNFIEDEHQKGTVQQAPATARIYLKQDLVKPENLKPEMLVRFRDVLPTSTDLERNGISESVTESASDNDTMSQD